MPKKDYFKINRGLNTESSEINFPDGFSTDERNYELLVDGSRKRRRGCAQESGGNSITTDGSIQSTYAWNTHKWRAAGGDPDTHFVIVQSGHELFFIQDDETATGNIRSEVIDISDYALAATVTTTVGRGVCSFASGRGTVIVTSKWCKPFYIDYDITNNEIRVYPIKLRHRDFYGIDDGVGDTINPTVTPTVTLPDDIDADHYYNLRNRGWPNGYLTTFADAQSAWPNKAQLWHKGLRRQTDVNYSDLDGIQTFDSAKLVAEQFGTSSAPQGSLILDPLDTRYSASGNDADGDEVIISTFTMARGVPKNGGTVTVTTSTVHGRTTNDYVTISGTLFRGDGFDGFNFYTIDGYWQITVNSTTEFTFELPAQSGKTFGAVWTPGQINGSVSLPKSDGVASNKGPTACAYFAGRAWFAGIPTQDYQDTVFFSKISEKPSTFGVCYQEQDPTNPEFNALSSSDGGTITIPGLGLVANMIPLRDALLVFAEGGVWEIGGGGRGAFTAGGYSVRKITEAGCTSPTSPVVFGNMAIYTGARGIHAIAPNQYTSVLEEQSMSDALVQTLWNNIPATNQREVKTVYDEALSRIYFLYDDGTATFGHQKQFALILDLRVGAFFKYQFNTGSTSGLTTMFTITDSDSSNSNKKVKWVAQTASTTLDVCDMDQSDYLDFDGAESPLPYFVTGWDNVGDFQRRRQAPIVTVYAKRTETGYTETGNGYDPDNESSNLLTAYWDWTDDSVSGKIGSQNETYRHVRGFLPSGTTDVDGYPVVVTRNKIRGRGRVLQLRFDGAATKDSHILGFSLNYEMDKDI